MSRTPFKSPNSRRTVVKFPPALVSLSLALFPPLYLCSATAAIVPSELFLPCQHFAASRISNRGFFPCLQCISCNQCLVPQSVVWELVDHAATTPELQPARALASYQVRPPRFRSSSHISSPSEQRSRTSARPALRSSTALSLALEVFKPRICEIAALRCLLRVIRIRWI